MLSKEAIKEFQKIYFKEYGETLAFEEAAARAESFLRFFKVIVKPSNHKGTCYGSKNNPSTTAQ
jgi:hypothetical protein